MTSRQRKGLAFAFLWVSAWIIIDHAEFVGLPWIYLTMVVIGLTVFAAD